MAPWSFPLSPYFYLVPWSLPLSPTPVLLIGSLEFYNIGALQHQAHLQEEAVYNVHVVEESDGQRWRRVAKGCTRVLQRLVYLNA